MSKHSIKDALKKLEDIAEWFETQKDIDIEEGLEKVKEAASLIKDTKKRLKDIENEFVRVKEEIEKDI